MTSAKSANPGAMNRYAARASVRRRLENDRAAGRSADALRPGELAEGRLEESVNLLRCAVQRLLDGLISLERLRQLRLQDLVDLRPLRRRRARPRVRDLLEVDRVVGMDLDELRRQALQHRHLTGARHLVLRPRTQHEPRERLGCRLVLRRLRQHDVLAADDADAAAWPGWDRRAGDLRVLEGRAEDRKHPRAVKRRDVLALVNPVV